jgi:hypothetical protein
VLARHSEFFEGLFRIPQPSGATDAPDIIDGCQSVKVYDHSIELSNLLRGLYDGVTFQNRSVSDFYYLASILRLSTKYSISYLRLKAIRFLAQTWTTTLAGHDELVEHAMKYPISPDNTSYPHVHPLHVLNLARQNNVEVVIPTALYFLSLYPLDSVLKADHLKLHIEPTHPSRPSCELSAVDVRDYSLVYQFRMAKMLEFIRRVCLDRPPSSHCIGEPTSGQSTPTVSRFASPARQRPCSHAFNRLGARLSRAWELRTGLLYFMVQATRELSQSEACKPCRTAFERDVATFRQETWNQLPSVIGLPSWEVLQQQLEVDS